MVAAEIGAVATGAATMGAAFVDHVVTGAVGSNGQLKWFTQGCRVPRWVLQWSVSLWA